MSLAPLNPNSGMTPIYGAPVRPQAPPPPPSAGPSDSFRATGAAPPPLPPAERKLPNGVIVRHAQDQHGISCQAALPGGPGMLLPVPLVVNVMNRQGQVEAQAFRTDGQPQALPSQVGPDGSVYVQFSPQAPLAVLNNDFSFGLSSQPQGTAQGGYTREKMETIEPDNTRMLLFNETAGPVGRDGTRERNFTEVRQNAQGLTANDVSERSGYGQKLGPNGQGWGDTLTNLTSGGRTEKPRSVAAQADGSLSLSAGSLKDHLVGALTGRSGWFTSPLLNASRQKAETVQPFSVLMQKYRAEFFTASPAAPAPAPPVAAAPPPLPAAPAPPPPPPPDRGAALLAAQRAMSYGDERTIAALGEHLGLEPNARTGEKFNSQATGAEAQQQLIEWRMGQALDLAHRSRADLAHTVLSGQHDRHQGSWTLPRLMGEEMQSNAFQDHYARCGWEFPNARFGTTPQEMAGRSVAILQRGEDGEVHEYRGTVVPEGDTAIFRLKEHPGLEFNNNEHRELALAPPGAPLPTPTVVVGGPLPEPTLGPSSPLAKASALEDAAYRLQNAQEASNLLRSLGQEANQRTGADFQPGLTGEDAQIQLKEWRLGQFLALTEADRPDLAMETLRGHHDELAGSSALGPLEATEAAHNEFFHRYESQGWHTKADPRYAWPHVQDDLNRREVAFLYDDAQSGRIEVRGRLTAHGPGSALFHVDGYPQEFNLNSLPAFAYNPR